MVGALKYVHYGYIVPAHSCHLCLHMSACVKRQYGTRAHKAKLYKIGDKVVKINPAIHAVVPGLYFTYCLDSRLNSLEASSTSLRGLAILA